MRSGCNYLGGRRCSSCICAELCSSEAQRQSRLTLPEVEEERGAAPGATGGAYLANGRGRGEAAELACCCKPAQHLCRRRQQASSKG
mmetsp:Transcript_56646/g.120511  ORF Transcript_56646/g.120511 Transcript_56646/m.120511 type:complete len:87 (-) Transcript_56646:60-320(-)